MTDLTPRQWEVARLLAEELTVEEIGNILFMSPHTVRFHIRMIADKIPGKAKPMRKIVVWYSKREAA